MTRTATIIVFVTIAALVVALGHYYLWRKLVKRTQPPRWLRRVATALVVSAALLVPTGFALSRLLPRDTIGPLIQVTYTWLGVVFYLLTLLALWDVPHLPLRVHRWWRRRRTRRASADGAHGERADRERSDGGSAADPGRRVFLARTVAGVAVVGAGTISAVGAREALGAFHTPEVPVRLERLPRALDGFRVVLVSDLHIGPWLDRAFSERVAGRVNALKPDLVAVVGDLVDGRVPLIGRDVAPLGAIEALAGVFFATGNHEYYSGVEPWLVFVRQLGWRVLTNERVPVGDRHPGGATFDLGGVPDHRGGRFLPDHAPDYAAVAAGRDPERELVLLAHQPVQVDGAASIGAGLQLSGHTHGGQLWPFGYLTGLVQPYIQGLHRHGDRTQIYVSAGTGFWGPPIRVLAPPEITVLVLSS